MSVGFHKEHINNHKVVAERGCCVVEVEDFVVNQGPAYVEDECF